MIENIGYLGGQELEELPYWETINNYLKGVELEKLQEIVCRLIKRLVRSRAFEKARSGDSLYACGPFFTACKEAGCRYLLRFKEGSIPHDYQA